MAELTSQLVLWSPAIVFGSLFAISIVREPRRFRNAVYLLVFLLWSALMLLLRYGQSWMLTPLVLFIILFPAISVVCLVLNGIIVVRRSGVSAVSLLPFALALLIVALCVSLPLSLRLRAPDAIILLIVLFMFEGMWFSFTLVALIIYSWLYRRLPRRRVYDYIIVLGAGLRGDAPSPLLAGRLDRGVDLWERQGKRGLLIVSGGKGSDEQVSEAQAMRTYLRSRGVCEQAILIEDRSTNTLENLMFSKAIMSARAEGKPYRVAVVTSDFHVFRAAEHARRLGISADGVGSRTRGWYWPAAFIREFVAITREHFAPYVLIALIWAIPIVIAGVLALIGG